MTGKSHPDMRERKQITVKMTEQFAKDLNLIFASYGMTDVSHVVRESVACQADAIRERMSKRHTPDPTITEQGVEAWLDSLPEEDA